MRRAATPVKITVRVSAMRLRSADFGRKPARSTAPPHSATSSAATPPHAASSTLSVTSCESKRPRLTPSASRTAISRRRLRARASSRFATLAAAMSRTITATPLIHVATLAKLDSLGPRSLSTEAIMARGRATAAGLVPFGLSAAWTA